MNKTANKAGRLINHSRHDKTSKQDVLSFGLLIERIAALSDSDRKAAMRLPAVKHLLNR